MKEAQLWAKGKLLTVMRANPIAWIAKAENSEVQEIHLFHKLQYAFMSMVPSEPHSGRESFDQKIWR